jgi:hypothetical protein
MRIILSDWLMSTIRLYEYPVVVCEIAPVTGGVVIYQAVTLVSVIRNPSENTITLVFVFTRALDWRLNNTSVRYLRRFAGPRLTGLLGLVIPSEYTWGQVALVEVIGLTGAF